MKEHFKVANLSVDVTRDEQLCNPIGCPVLRFVDRVKKGDQTFRGVMSACLYLRVQLKVYSDTDRVALFNERQRPKSPIYSSCDHALLQRKLSQEQTECGSISIQDEAN